MALQQVTSPAMLDTTGQAIVTAINNLAEAGGIGGGGSGASSVSIAPIETTTTASKAYAVGDLLFYNNILYKVTAPIAQGGTIAISGASANVVQTDVDTELKNKIKVSSTAGLVKNDGTIDTSEYATESYVDNAIPSVDTELSPTSENPVQNKVITNLIPNKDWISKTWNKKPSFGIYVWNDGDYVYYTDNSKMMVLNKDTGEWNDKNWTVKQDFYLDNFFGDRIWVDGNNVYYSGNGGLDLVLNKTLDKWESKNWSSEVNIEGMNIWTDGENIYYSEGYNSTNLVLDRGTSTWNTKTWNGLTSFDGQNIWTDGENIYYSYESSQYVLDKATSTWIAKTWTGLTNFDGQFIWTYEGNIYYSYNSNHYILDKSTSTWNPKTWNGYTGFDGNYLWTDGENIYYSGGSGYQYVLSKEKGFGTSVSKNYTESITSSNKDLVTSGAVASTLNNYVQKSSTGGLLKNNGTVDTNTYPSSTITSPANKQILEYNSTSAKWENKNKFTALTGTLDAGETELTFTNAVITATARFETYTEDIYLPLVDIVRDGTTLTLTFPKQEEDVNVKVLIYED